MRETLDRILAEAAAQPAKKSAFGLLAQHGPGLTEEEIDEDCREMLRSFGEDLPFPQASTSRAKVGLSGER